MEKHFLEVSASLALTFIPRNLSFFSSLWAFVSNSWGQNKMEFLLQTPCPFVSRSPPQQVSSSFFHPPFVSYVSPWLHVCAGKTKIVTGKRNKDWICFCVARLYFTVTPFVGSGFYRIVWIFYAEKTLVEPDCSIFCWNSFKLNTFNTNVMINTRAVGEKSISWYIDIFHSPYRFIMLTMRYLIDYLWVSYFCFPPKTPTDSWQHTTFWAAL